MAAVGIGGPLTDLRTLVSETPEIVSELRSALFFGKPSIVESEVDTEIAQVHNFTSKPPLHVGTLEAADLEAATLIQWAEHFGIRVSGAVWRRSDGVARGLLYDDLRPVLDARAGLLDMFDHGWVDDDGVMSMSVGGVRAVTMRGFGWLRDAYRDEVEVEVVDDGQLGFNI